MLKRLQRIPDTDDGLVYAFQELQVAPRQCLYPRDVNARDLPERPPPFSTELRLRKGVVTEFEAGSDSIVAKHYSRPEGIPQDCFAAVRDGDAACVRLSGDVAQVLGLRPRPVEGSPASFHHPLLTNCVPFHYNLYAYRGEILTPGGEALGMECMGNFELQPQCGVLRFRSPECPVTLGDETRPVLGEEGWLDASSRPPLITFYRYVGPTLSDVLGAASAGANGGGCLFCRGGAKERR